MARTKQTISKKRLAEIEKEEDLPPPPPKKVRKTTEDPYDLSKSAYQGPEYISDNNRGTHVSAETLRMLMPHKPKPLRKVEIIHKPKKTVIKIHARKK